MMKSLVQMFACIQLLYACGLVACDTQVGPSCAKPRWSLKEDVLYRLHPYVKPQEERAQIRIEASTEIAPSLEENPLQEFASFAAPTRPLPPALAAFPTKGGKLGGVMLMMWIRHMCERMLPTVVQPRAKEQLQATMESGSALTLRNTVQLPRSKQSHIRLSTPWFVEEGQKVKEDFDRTWHTMVRPAPPIQPRAC